MNEALDYEVPRFGGDRFNRSLTIKLDEPTKRTLDRLRHDHNVNIAEWVRMLVDRELPRLRAKLGV